MACPKPNVPNSQLKLYADKTYKKENVSAPYLYPHCVCNNHGHKDKKYHCCIDSIYRIINQKHSYCYRIQWQCSICHIYCCPYLIKAIRTNMRKKITITYIFA